MTDAFFRDSEDLDVLYKMLNWGPENVGKTHFMLSWSEVGNGIAVMDFENRASQMKDRFKFKHAVPTTISAGIAMLEHIAAGKMNVATVGVDSLTKPYLAYVKKFSATKKGRDGGEYVATDWPAVNRAMQTEFVEPLFAIKGKHIICSARQGSDLKRDGNEFIRRGVKIVGDEVRWRFDYDYVLHWVQRGLVKVEKSMSAYLPVETEIYGDLDAARFIRLARGEEDVRAVPRGAKSAPAPRPAASAAPASAPAPAPAPAPAAAPPQERDGNAVPDLDVLLQYIEGGPTRSIMALARAKNLDDAQLAARIAAFTKGAPLGPDAYSDFVASLKAT